MFLIHGAIIIKIIFDMFNFYNWNETENISQQREMCNGGIYVSYSFWIFDPPILY